MGGAPLLHVTCIGQGPLAGGLSLLCAPWAALQFPTANADAITFASSWVRERAPKHSAAAKSPVLVFAARSRPRDPVPLFLRLAASPVSAEDAASLKVLGAAHATYFHLSRLPSPITGRLQHPILLVLCTAGGAALHLALQLEPPRPGGRRLGSPKRRRRQPGKHGDGPELRNHC